MLFQQRIAAIRKEFKFSQEKFGELVGVSQRTVAFWEAGLRMPSHAVTAALADRLGVSVDYLLGRTDVKAPTKKQPAAQGSELLDDIIDRLRDLPDPMLRRVSDFLAGMEAARQAAPAPAGPDTGAASPAAPDPAGGPAE